MAQKDPTSLFMNIFDRNEKSFKGYGIGVITDAYNIKVKQTKNQEYSLTFQIPKSSPAFDSLLADRFIRAFGTVFIIRRIEVFSSYPEVSVEIYCEHIIFTLLDEYIELFSHSNSTVQFMLNELFKNHKRFKAYSGLTGGVNSQVTGGTRMKNLVNICENAPAIWTCSNLPDDNGFFTINLIEDGGVEAGFLVHNRHNLDSIKRTTDGSGVVTRLWVYGSDNKDISSVNKGKKYIDSTNIQNYPYPKEGTITYDTQTDPATLLNYGKKYLASVDHDKVSYEVNMSEIMDQLGKNVKIGDVITVIDENINERVKVMVVDYEWDVDNDNGKVTLNELVGDLAKLINGITTKGETDTGTTRGNVWTEWTTVPFSLAKHTIMFTNRYRTAPVVQVQVLGSSDNSPILIKHISQVDNGLTYITGIEVTVSSGSGSAIMMQSIGRID